MQNAELQAMTVVQLRKLAKENGVKLSAGIDKSGIVARLADALAEEAEPGPRRKPQPSCLSRRLPRKRSLRSYRTRPFRLMLRRLHRVLAFARGTMRKIKGRSVPYTVRHGRRVLPRPATLRRNPLGSKRAPLVQ